MSKPRSPSRNIIAAPYTFSKSTDPLNIYYSGDWVISFHNWATLVILLESGEVAPLLASQWSVSPDGLVYTFTLRAGIKWSNGHPITSEDVAFSLRRSAQGTSHSDLSSAIESIEPMKNAVVIKIRKQIPSFLVFLTYVDWSIIHRTSFSNDDQNKVISTSPASGPYHITNVMGEGTIASVIEMERNNFWFKSLPIERIKFKKISKCADLIHQHGEVIAFREYADNWTKDCNDFFQLHNFNIEKGPTTWSLKADFTSRAKKRFSTTERLELVKFVRQKLKESAVLNEPGYFESFGLRPPGTRGTLTSQEFEELFINIRSISQSRSLKIVAQDSWSKWKGFTWLIELLKSINHSTTVTELSSSEYSKYLQSGELQNNYDLILSPLGVSDPDPDGSWRIARKYFFPAEISDDTLSNAFFEMDANKRSDLYKGIEFHLLRSGAYIPLFFTNQIVVINKDFKPEKLSQIYHGMAAFDLITKK